MRIIIFLLLAILTFSAQSKPSRNEVNLNWMLNNYSEIEKNISTKQPTVLIPILNTLTDIWVHRDGATTTEVSPLIIEALIYKPKLMLSMLADKPDSFDRWLTQFSGQIFRDFSGKDFDELVLLHKQLNTSMLDFSKNGVAELKPYADKIIQQLKVTKVSKVD